jgi:hypothetical protein
VTCPWWLSVDHGMEIVQAFITHTICNHSHHAGLFVTSTSRGGRRTLLVLLLLASTAVDGSNKTHAKLPDPRVADSRGRYTWACTESTGSDPLPRSRLDSM